VSETKAKSTSVIHLVVEVDSESVWGDDCTMAQVAKQAREAAAEHSRRLVRRILDNAEGEYGYLRIRQVTVEQEIKVKLISGRSETYSVRQGDLCTSD